MSAYSAGIQHFAIPRVPSPFDEVVVPCSILPGFDGSTSGFVGVEVSPGGLTRAVVVGSSQLAQSTRAAIA